jgi:hypothetical protein
MLPIATVQGVRDGISTGMIIDLSEYLKKTEGVSKEEMQSLESVVANKLDIEPQHKHHLEDIKQLQSSLDSKYDKGEKYSYNVILSDSEKIPYLENPKITLMELVQNKEMSGYKFYVDESNGDLMIILNEILIGHYSKSGNKWVMNGITETLQNSMNNYATKDHVHEDYASINHVHEDYATKAMLDEQTLIENVNIKTKINELETVVQNQQNNFASVNHTHKILDNDLTVNGTIDAKKLKSNTMTFESIDENAGKCSISGTDIWKVQKNSWMYIYKILSLSQSLIVDENATVRKNLNVKTSLTLNGWDVETKIKELENILQNHYQALMLLLEKHDMVDTNTGDGSNITPSEST